MKDFLRRSDEGFFFVGQTKGSLVRKKKQKPFPRKKGFRKGGQVSFLSFENTLSLDHQDFLKEGVGDRKKGRGRSRTAVKSFAGSCLTPGPHDHSTRKGG